MRIIRDQKSRIFNKLQWQTELWTPRRCPTQSCFDFRGKMNFPNEHYYKHSRNFLIALGLWPHKHPILHGIQRTFFILMFAFSICLQFAKIITSVFDLELLCKILSFTIPCLCFSLKYATFCLKARDVQKLMEKLKYNWIITKRKKELEILHQYSFIGYLLTIAVSITFYSIVVIFLSIQILPKLLDIVVPLNESRPCKLLGVATFFFDDKKHFVAIYVHMTVALFSEVTTILGTETMTLTYIQHSMALFKITSFRIENLVNYELGIPVSLKETVLHTNIIDIVISHNKAIEYFEFFNSTFGMSYFMLLTLGVLSLSVNLFRLFHATSVGETKEAIAITLLVFCHFFYIFAYNLLGQTVTNISSEIFYLTCNLPWYAFPVRLQKMIRLIIRRSMIDNKFILGHLFETSLEFFTTVMSTSMSYFTVIWSMRE